MGMNNMASMRDQILKARSRKNTLSRNRNLKYRINIENLATNARPIPRASWPEVKIMPEIRKGDSLNGRSVKPNL